ncbi:MAG: hypothetical protein A4E66_00529 [Syntrophus sp. PtaB.Bin001]|nr:MAG: hypothetical protein A4E66_00529 [Syntrophus sp. PtaB.Bin001]
MGYFFVGSLMTVGGVLLWRKLSKTEGKDAVNFVVKFGMRVWIITLMISGLAIILLSFVK